MKNKRSAKQYTNSQRFSLLVAFDFSPYSIQALRTARSILGQKPGRIVVLHVIDRDFVEKCVRSRLATESHIKETLFRQAKAKLQNFLRKEGMDGGDVEKVVCEGTPFIEINKKALESGVDMVVLGNRGSSGDIETIFFGSTAERVLRFMKRPVLCVPMAEDQD